ncbi:hypothetical protein Tco_0760154 [Tanacetum coccineum]
MSGGGAGRRERGCFLVCKVILHYFSFPNAATIALNNIILASWEESKLVLLNDLIAEALDDIDTLETDVEILDGDVNGV